MAFLREELGDGAFGPDATVSLLCQTPDDGIGSTYEMLAPEATAEEADLFNLGAANMHEDSKAIPQLRGPPHSVASA